MDTEVDLLAIGGIVGLRASVLKPLFWIALIAGVALFAIPLSAADSWTGHLVLAPVPCGP